MNEFLLAVWKAFCPFSITHSYSVNRTRQELESKALQDLQTNALALDDKTIINYVYSLLPRLTESYFDRRSLENFYKFELKSYKDLMFNVFFLQQHIPLSSDLVLNDVIISKLVYKMTSNGSNYYICKDLSSQSLPSRYHCYSEQKFNQRYNPEVHKKIILDVTFTDIYHENLRRGINIVR